MTKWKKPILVNFMTGPAILVGLDQWIKGPVVVHLKGHKPFVIWDGAFKPYYPENRGAASGVMQKKQPFFFLIALLILDAVAYLMVKMSIDRKYRPMSVRPMMVSAGMIGNMIDRISQGYTVDFLYLKLINFLIFNVADCHVTIAVTYSVILIMFYYKDEGVARFAIKKHGNAEKE